VDGGKRRRALDAHRAFLTTPLDRLLDAAAGDGREEALRLFHEVAASVPARSRRAAFGRTRRSSPCRIFVLAPAA
jgi:hypothetical protein